MSPVSSAIAAGIRQYAAAMQTAIIAIAIRIEVDIRDVNAGHSNELIDKMVNP
jgi:hypothetical protein